MTIFLVDAHLNLADNYTVMSEEPTQDLSDRSRSFEERVFARFDVIDSRLKKLEARAYDTKPIWERALKEILEGRLEFGELKSKVDGIETRVIALEGEVSGMRGDFATLRSELVETQREFKTKLTRQVDIVINAFVDSRDSMRTVDERLTQLESKLA